MIVEVERGEVGLLQILTDQSFACTFSLWLESIDNFDEVVECGEVVVYLVFHGVEPCLVPLALGVHQLD